MGARAVIRSPSTLPPDPQADCGHLHTAESIPFHLSPPPQLASRRWWRGTSPVLGTGAEAEGEGGVERSYSMIGQKREGASDGETPP